MKYLKQGYETEEIRYPVFLVNMQLCVTAKLVYTLLYDRAVKNGLMDEKGRIYVIFTVKEMSKAMGKSEMTVKTSLKSLEDKGLMERRFTGVAKPTNIFLLVPKQVIKTVFF